MKRLYKCVSGLFLAGFLSVLMISSASAQRGARGGGGGVRISGGGGGYGVGYSGRSGVGYRGSVGINGAHGALSYRSGVGYYAGVGYHGGAFYRPGFGYYGYPHYGFYLGYLPYGYYPFYWGAGLYYYYGGIFYSPYDNGGYQVVAPPIGAAVPDLPSNAQPIKIDSVQYYELDGVYYKEGVDDQGKKIYIVVGKDGVLNTTDSATDPNADANVAAPQVGDIVNQLPDGCHKVILNGKKYYVSPNDIYYEKVTDPNGNVGYKIVSLPTDEKGA
ncbi:MAG TPA: DUF6515 family protein [Mucilaginibacter sp.]|jgi:hypothetical protein